MAAVGVVRKALECHLARSPEEGETTLPPRAKVGDIPSDAQEELAATAAAMSAPPALQTLCAMFDLSAFERHVLLFCAGIEVDSAFAALCAEAQGDPARAFPSFSLAMAALPEAHWSAMSPASPLRYWRLIEVGSGPVLTRSQLRIDERILNYLTGVQHIDDRLAGFIAPLYETGELVPSHRTLVRRIAASWTDSTGGSLPIVQLCGVELTDMRAIAVAACGALGLRVCLLSGQSLPPGATELEGLIRLWKREAGLSNSALLLECHELEVTDAARVASINRLIGSLDSPLIISNAERWRNQQKSLLTFEVRKPTACEQRDIWQTVLRETPFCLDGEVGVIASQFNLSREKVFAARAVALGQTGSRAEADEVTDAEFGEALWNACRMQARPRLDDLAQRIEPAASWKDLVLPGLQLQSLREVAVHARRRVTVYETWGFEKKGARGLGISALFSGMSGTGKTMAAEVLANELRLDLYRIDLSAVVSKYIGETEKNLRRVFDVAEEGGAILLFDEADALFGKRSEVKDSHDRYANIEVSYLLQRMEAYRGLAILTTNLKNALDPAFIRRIRFILQFPFPDAAQRAEIWRHIFPCETPTEHLDAEKLSRLNVAGGNIRNIALNAAFLAADAGEPVRMTHLLRSAQGEYTKLEKSLTDAEIRGWV
ncbi:MAG: ATP-binding protein [Pyrinomonadaceae bacterium]|nr:ATP-binding protein [Pyrinomonadaceae bacterium]